MKQPRFFAHLATAIVLVTALAVLPAHAHDDDLGQDFRPAGSLDGTWRLVTPPLGDGLAEYKFVAGGRFTWMVVADGRIVRGAEGRASLRDGVYNERIDSVISDEYRWMVGGRGRFDARLEGDRWRHRGTVENGGMRIEIDEVWERVR